jgi:DUF4097 and DUF4098 domain-containing protein YvlB
MSSAPPNPNYPPPPPPPYDPKMQWRVYREQQKAAWRAQRDAWRAQRHAWKSQYWGAPRVPSIVGPLILIAIGVIWLLIYTGHLQGHEFWTWYAHWWPVVLILAGVAMLGEWMLDMRRPTPVYRRGSFVGLVILLAIFGMIASGTNHLGINGPWNWNGDGSDFWNMMGQPEHDSDQAVINQELPANAAIEIENPRGDISISAGDGSAIEVQSHEVAYANSDGEAGKVFDAEKTVLTVNGSAALVRAGSNDRGKVNLSVIVPASAHVSVNASHGDVTVSGLNGINVTAAHGDTHLSAINGPVVAHLSGNKGDFSAHQVTGDVTTNGNCGDLTLSEIKGQVAINGDIFGDAHLENITGPIRLHTSVTELDLASLPGDITLDSDDLRVNEAKGTVHVTTHSKDVDLSQVYGDSYVENRDGSISVSPAGAFGVEARNAKGDIEITLPPNSAGTVDGSTRNGDIVSDFALTVSGDENKTVSGKIGAGGPRIYLSTDNGDLHIKKGPAFPATPPPAGTAAGAAAPEPPANGRHLKATKTLPEQPVTQ